MAFTPVTAGRQLCNSLVTTYSLSPCPQSRAILLLQFFDSSFSLLSPFFRLLQQNAQEPGKQGSDKVEGTQDNPLAVTQVPPGV